MQKTLIAKDSSERVNHANRRLNDLKTFLDSYIRTEPISTRLEYERNKVQHYFKLESPPPVEISLLTGEVIASLRSALEYQAVHIAGYLNDKPLLENEEKQLLFPLFRNRKDFDHKFSKMQKRSPQLHKRWTAIVKKVQPFARASSFWKNEFGAQTHKAEHLDFQRFIQNTLIRMFELSNHDKHRRLQPTWFVPNLFLSSGSEESSSWKIHKWKPNDGDLVATMSGKFDLNGKLPMSEIQFGLYLPNSNIHMEVFGDLDEMKYATEYMLKFLNFEFEKKVKV